MAKPAEHGVLECLPGTAHCAVVAELSEMACQITNMISAGVAAAQNVYLRMDFPPLHSPVFESA